MPIISDIVAQIDKNYILDSSHQNLLIDTYLFWFRGGPHVSIVFGNDIILTPFLVTWFSNLHILWNLE